MLVEPRPPVGDELLERVMDAVEPALGAGRVHDAIPALAPADPQAFGFAVAGVDGAVHGIGDWRRPFSIQGISKAFALALVVARDAAALWSRVGREPSGDAFNSLVALEHDHGVPRNPFINAGALVVTDHLLSLTGDACGAVCDLLSAETGGAAVDWDPDVAASEAAHSHRNAALAHLIASFGNLRNDVDEVLAHYVRGCAIQLSCGDVALAASVLARHGVRRDGTRLLSRSDAKRVNAVMLMCGTYGGAGEVAYRSGCRPGAASAAASSPSSPAAARCAHGGPRSTRRATRSPPSPRSTRSRR